MKRSVVWLGVGVIFIVLLGFVSFYLLTAAGPMPAALSAMQSDDKVMVTTASHWIVFNPKMGSAQTGFIFYPGGKVDYRSYAPVLHAIAASGFLVVDVKMPFNLAVLTPNKAEEVLPAFPEIKHWVIGGHSLGGAMAANFIFEHSQAVQGLVLWAAYPAANNSLFGSKIKVISIVGSLDGLVTESKQAEAHKLLPLSTRWVQIAGGNHAQFGDYGLQVGDNLALIDPQFQWLQTINATVDFLKSIE